MAARKALKLDLRNPVLGRIHHPKKYRGLAAEIARHLGISSSAVWQWKQVPDRYVVKVGKLLQIETHLIRPDIFPK